MSSKVSDLPIASNTTPSDVLYLVQGSVDKQLSILNLFANLSTPLGAGVLSFPQTPEIITSGAVSLTIPVSQLSLNGNTTITLANGTPQQIKILVATATAGSSSATINANIFNTSITFSKAGDTAMLMYTGTAWAFIGGTARVI